MDFMEQLKQESLKDDYNVAYSENGAKMYRTTGKALLDFSFQVSTLRKASEKDICSKFTMAFLEDPEYAFKFLFYLRDCLQGLGERRSFRVILAHLAKSWTDNDGNTIIDKILPLIPEYGRWDDLLCLLDTPCKHKVVNIIKDQINKDWENMNNNKSISLCAKWLPSINTSSSETKRLAKILIKELNLTEKTYRTTLSALRKYTNVVETKMSRNQWDQIKYETVPSKANLIYQEAFLRNDNERRSAYIQNLQNSINDANVVLEDININAKACFPYEIVSKYLNHDNWNGATCKSYNTVLEAMWLKLMSEMPTLKDIIVVADSSGSMVYNKLNSNTCCLDVANSFAIACSERLQGPYKDKIITFSSSPKFLDLSKYSTLHDKLEYLSKHSIVENTDIEKVFSLILKTAVNNKVKPEDMPKTILIISDMGFDEGTRNNNSLFTNIQNDYKQAGYQLPQLVFLNVADNSRNNGAIPVVTNKNGAVLMSGFSANIMNMIIQGEMDPWNVLKKILDSKRYTPIILNK